MKIWYRDIDAIPAGDAMDRLVEVYAFGHTECICEPPIETSSAQYMPEACVKCDRVVTTREDLKQPYSTDPQWAAKIVKHLVDVEFPGNADPLTICRTALRHCMTEGAIEFVERMRMRDVEKVRQWWEKFRKELDGPHGGKK